MPEDVLEAVNRGKDSMRLAMTLRKHLDQVYPSGRKLSQAWDGHNKQKLWLVDTPAGNHPQNESASVTTDAGMAGICSIPPRGRKNRKSLYRECIGETPAPPAAKATDSDCRAGGIPADPGRISEDLQAGARRAALKEAHDRTPTFKKCDRCGKLLEHGSFQVNDESICLQCFSLEGDI